MKPFVWSLISDYMRVQYETAEMTVARNNLSIRSRIISVLLEVHILTYPDSEFLYGRRESDFSSQKPPFLPGKGDFSAEKYIPVLRIPSLSKKESALDLRNRV